MIDRWGIHRHGAAHGEGGILPGEPGARYAAFPTLVMLMAAPVLVALVATASAFRRSATERYELAGLTGLAAGLLLAWFIPLHDETAP